MSLRRAYCAQFEVTVSLVDTYAKYQRILNPPMSCEKRPNALRALFPIQCGIGQEDFVDVDVGFEGEDRAGRAEREAERQGGVAGVRADIDGGVARL